MIGKVWASYLIREFLKILLMILTTFVSVFCIVDFFEKNARYFPKYNPPMSVVLEFYLTQVPKLTVDVLPFTVMFSAIIVLWTFSRSGEISVLRAAGMPVSKICLPLFAVGLCLAVCSFLASEYVVPKTSTHLRWIETVKIENEKLDRMFFESNWIRGTNSFLRYGWLDRFAGSLEQPEYFVFSDRGTITQFVQAQRAVFDPLEGRWILQNAAVTHFGVGQKKLQISMFPAIRTTVYSHPPRLLKEGITHDQLSYRQLRTLVRESKQSGGMVAEREVELYQKLAFPFANVIFIFLAVPFALRKERQADTYIGVALVLVLALLFWLGNEVMRSLAQSSRLNPVLAAWTTSVVFTFFGIYLLRKVDKPS